MPAAQASRGAETPNTRRYEPGSLRRARRDRRLLHSMDQRRRHHPAASAPAAPAGRAPRGRRHASPLRDALRTRDYQAGRDLLSPNGDAQAGGRVSGSGQLGDLSLRGSANDPSLKSVSIDGVQGQRDANGAGLDVDHVGVRSAHSDAVDVGIRHAPSGVGARAHATDATLHQTDVAGAKASAGRDGLDVSADHVSWLNTGAAAAGGRVDSTKTGHSAQVDATGLRVHKADVHDAALHADASGLRVRAADTQFTNVAADHVSAQVDGPNSHTAIAADGLGVHEARVQQAQLQADRSGLQVGAEDVAFTNLRADHVRAEHSNPAGQGHLAATDLAVHDTHVGGATFGATRQGLDTHADSVDFVNTRAAHVQGAAQTRGGSQINASADDLSVHELAVRDADVHLGRRGIEASAASVAWQNTAMDSLLSRSPHPLKAL